MASTASDSQVQLHRVLLVIIAVVLPVLGLVWPQREPTFDPMWARLGFTVVALGAVANMSHELRTPLNAILGYCELLTEDVEDPTAQQDLGHIDTAARHLLRIVTDVLDLARIEADKLSLHLEPVDLAAIVADCVAIVRPTAEVGGNELHVELQAGRVRADAIRLRQVLLELLQNAARFTTDGHITVRSRVVDDTVEISVVDTGPGIAPEDHHRVFERFAQLDDSATRRHDGAGLGLAICQELTMRMQGEIHLASDVGEGASFTVVLPTADARGELIPLHPERAPRQATGSPSGD